MSPDTEWHHGYYAAEGYTYGFYREMAPAALAWMGMLQGVELPTRNFRYVDLGCGQGFNLVLLAASHPESEFVGVDFMPNHVDHGRKLAKAAGLTNVQFVEADFTRLASGQECLNDLQGQRLDGRVEYVVAHGIATWVAPEVREALWSVAGRLLAPGGVHYTSYNTLPGWLPVLPFQHLILQYQARGLSGVNAIKKAQATLAAMEASRSSLQSAFPTLKNRLEAAAKLDPAYLTQEYNNTYWQPQFVVDMMSAAGRHKLSFLGSATLPELFDGLLPPSVLKVMNEEPDRILREGLRDLGIHQSFRRDVYVRGHNPVWPGRRGQIALAARAISLPTLRLPEAVEGKLDLNTPLGKLRIDHAVVQQTLELLQRPEGASIAEVMAVTGETRVADVAQRVSLMMHSGWVAPLLGASGHQAAALNRCIGQQIIAGAPYKFISVPKTGSATTLDGIVGLMLGLAARSGAGDQVDEASIVQSILNRDMGVNVTLNINGQATTQGPAYEAEVRQKVQDFARSVWPQWRAWQMV